MNKSKKENYRINNKKLKNENKTLIISCQHLNQKTKQKKINKNSKLNMDKFHCYLQNDLKIKIHNINRFLVKLTKIYLKNNNPQNS